MARRSPCSEKKRAAKNLLFLKFFRWFSFESLLTFLADGLPFLLLNRLRIWLPMEQTACRTCEITARQLCRDFCCALPWIALAATTSLKVSKAHRSELPALVFAVFRWTRALAIHFVCRITRSHARTDLMKSCFDLDQQQTL
jgi:hypothetical protein